jgi:hypothetical protein
VEGQGIQSYAAKIDLTSDHRGKYRDQCSNGSDHRVLPVIVVCDITTASEPSARRKGYVDGGEFAIWMILISTLAANQIPW